MRPFVALIALACLVMAPLGFGLAGGGMAATPCPIPMTHTFGCATALGHALHVRHALEGGSAVVVDISAPSTADSEPLPHARDEAPAAGPPRPTALQEQFAAGILQRKEAPHAAATPALFS